LIVTEPYSRIFRLSRHGFGGVIRIISFLQGHL